MYNLQGNPITPLPTLLNCKEIALKSGLNYVYIGNVGFEVDNNTYCHFCKKILIERGVGIRLKRKGYATKKSNHNKDNNLCSNCENQSPFRN